MEMAPIETFDQPRFYRVGGNRDDNRDRRRRLLGYQRRDVSSACNDNRDVVANEFGGHRGQPVIVIVRPTKFDPDILSLDETQFREAPTEKR